MNCEDIDFILDANTPEELTLDHKQAVDEHFAFCRECRALEATIAIVLVASLASVVTAARSPVQSRALSTPRVTRRTPRTVLLASQVAITLVLVAGAGLFTRSLVEALTLNPAIPTGRIVTAFVNLGQHGYTPERAAAFVDELLARLRQNGAIESASLRARSLGPAAAALRGGGVRGVPQMRGGWSTVSCASNARTATPRSWSRSAVSAEGSARCGARRMAETAALLVEEVLPRKPLRQPKRFAIASMKTGVSACPAMPRKV